jgi:transcriptional regulator with XRE-family HTH domain
VPNSNRQIARFVAQHTGESCSAEYIAQLRKGHRDNPTRRILEALAAFFDVSAGYFVDDAYADQIQAQIELLFSLRESDLRLVALRDLMLTLRDHAVRLGADDLRLLEDMVRSISSRSTVATAEAPPVR